MSTTLNVALIQMHIAAGDPEANFAKAERLLEEAATASSVKPDIIMLPEMWNSGYALTEIERLADPDGERTKTQIASFAARHGVNVIAGSIAHKRATGVTNTMLAFDRDGNPTLEYSKIHLFKLMNEHQHLLAGEKAGTFQLGPTSAGAMICYDIRFPELARKLALGGAKILFVPAQWPHPRLHHWRTLLQARAIENQMYVVACNTVGESGGSSFFGHSMIVDPWGEIVAEAEEQETILRAAVDLSLVDEVRGRIPVFADRLPTLYE